MPFYLTRDSVPSADMRNVFDNAQNLDLALNDLTSSLWTDRLGRSRMSWFGLESAFSVKLSDFESRFTSQIVEQEATFDASQADKENRFQHFLVSSGYVFLGDYEDGPFQFSARNQYIRYDNQYYRLNAATDVGFTTTGTDATSFANDVAHLVLMDGDVLRQELASPSGASNVGLSQGGTVQDAVYWLTPEMFGAKASDPSFDNQYKIQEAIDAANSEYLSTGSIQTVYIPNGVFWVGNRTITNTGESTQNGLLSIQMKSGVRLCGEGTIKAKANAYGSGAYYRMIGSDRGDRVQDVEIIGITLDGNVSNQVASTQCSNMVLEASRNILIDGVKSVNSNGNGMMIRGRYPDAVHNVRIVNCYVYNCNFIGIQSSQFNGLVISNNTVDTTADNGIDIYGDTNISYSDSNGINFSITGNTVKNSRCGIFPETVSYGTVAGNSIYNCPRGIHVNRIRSVTKNIVVTGNSIVKSTGGGVRVTGDIVGLTVCGNTFSDWTGSAVKLGASGGSVSGVYVHDNTFIPSEVDSYVISTEGAVASRIEVRNNVVRNNTGIAKANLYYNTATTSTAVHVDSWAITGSSFENTGLQMYQSVTRAPTVFGSTSAGTASYTTQSGKFMRIGELVYYTIAVTYSDVTGTGTLRIGNLPWAPNDSIPQPSVIADCNNVTLTAGQNVWATPEANSINFRIKTSGSTANPDYLRLTNPAYLSGGISVSGWYYL
ncbi:right-handed parallel beta-helix repeat-containing protein [Klebsiella pneumoniae]